MTWVGSADPIRNSTGIGRPKWELGGKGSAPASPGRAEAVRAERRPQATVLMVGYQAPGTLGALLEGGEKLVRLMGEEVAVKARIRSIGNYSAHADQRELVAWVKERLPVHAGVFLTHGEERAREVLRGQPIAAGIEAPVQLPKLDESFELAAAAAPAARRRVMQRVADEQITDDWHNDYARLLLGLGRKLEELPDDAARRDLLRRMRDLLPG